MRKSHPLQRWGGPRGSACGRRRLQRRRTSPHFSRVVCYSAGSIRQARPPHALDPARRTPRSIRREEHAATRRCEERTVATRPARGTRRSPDGVSDSSRRKPMRKAGQGSRRDAASVVAAALSSCSTSCTKPAASLAVSMACRSRPTSSASLSLIRSPVPVRSTILWTLATSGAAGPTTGTTATNSGVGCIFLAVLIPTFGACQPSLIIPARCCIAPKMASAVFSGIPAVSAASFAFATARSSLPAIAANNSSISCSWKPALRPVW